MARKGILTWVTFRGEFDVDASLLRTYKVYQDSDIFAPSEDFFLKATASMQVREFDSDCNSDEVDVQTGVQLSKRDMQLVNR